MLFLASSIFWRVFWIHFGGSVLWSSWHAFLHGHMTSRYFNKKGQKTRSAGPRQLGSSFFFGPNLAPLGAATKVPRRQVMYDDRPVFNDSAVESFLILLVGNLASVVESFSSLITVVLVNFLHQLVSGLSMFIHVYPCLSMFIHVYPWLSMSIHVSPCFSMFLHVYPLNLSSYPILCKVS